MNTGRLLLSLALALASASAFADEEFTTHFPLGSCQFSSVGGNSYFMLVPGQQRYFSNAACVSAGKCEALDEVWITTERFTKRITLDIGGKTEPQNVFARVVEERETEDGDLTEISRNYFVNCLPSRDIYYFGEDVDIYEDGKIVGHESAWLAGKHGARPGIAMPEDGFMLGQRYFQEVAPGVAMDQTKHVRADFTMHVPAGEFDHCIEVRETTPLEPDDISSKIYCRGVGLVKDDDLELMAVYDPN